MKKIKFGIPGGSLQESMKKLLKGAGFDFKILESPIVAVIDDPEIECFFDRANEIARLVSNNILDGAVLSKASLQETKAKYKEISRLGTPSFDWQETKIVLAVPEKSRIRTVKDLEGKKIITRLPEIARDFLAKNKIKAEIEVVDSSAEAKLEGLGDALVEFTNTGTTLKFYNLRIVETILDDANILFLVASEQAFKDYDKKKKLEDLAFLLKGARDGQEMVGIILHASNDMMEEVLKKLPSLKKPTVTHLRGENWFEVFSVLDRKKSREIIPVLKKIGCTDIVEFSLTKVIV